MSIYTHTVERGENPWKFVKQELSKNGKCSNKDIANNLKKLATENGCSSVEEFGKKYFSSVGKSFSFQSLHEECVSKTSEVELNSIIPQDCRTSVNICVQDTFTPRTAFTPFEIEMTTVNAVDTAWTKVTEIQDAINSLPSNKDIVIEYNKNINKSRENYIIVDKENFSATVYSWDGKVIKEFEVGVGKKESDELTVRSKANPLNNNDSTTAGIYTINYRASGHDDYKKLYDNRIFTMSNDGLSARGIGNGETGVALHQIPNGNTKRVELMNREGATKENNRFSNGCINFMPEDFDELASLINGVGTKVYILPEDSNNYMTVKNGKLHFVQRKYTGNVATTSTKSDPIYPINIYANKQIGGESETMMACLSDRKAELIKDLGIDNDTYNDLALLALGIAGQETDFGVWNSFKYHIKEHCQWGVNLLKRFDKANGKSVANVNSRGLTQMKLDCYTDKNVIKLMEKYGINEDNLNDGENAAIATMIALTSIYKNELPFIKEKMKSQNLSNADALLYCWQGKKSIINNGNANPDKNGYIINVRKYMNNFTLMQTS